MYRALLYIAAFSLSFLLAGCSSCSNSKKDSEERQAEQEKAVNPKVQQLDETPDEAFEALMDNFTKDSIYIRVTKTGERKSYDITHARAMGTLHGSIVKGDVYSIFPDNKQKAIQILINTTELRGRWFYNQQQHRGIDFNDGGGMSSINSERICFREWKLLNGKMYIYYVDMQDVASDRHQYNVEEANIQKLDSKKLTFTFLGTTYNCRRPSNKPIMLN